MRKLSYILTITLTVLLFVACSKDDILQSSPSRETEEAGTVPVKFTATVDYSIEEIGGEAAKAASTRATADVDDAPIRFYGQAVSTVANTLQSEVIEGTLNAQTGKYEFVFHLTPQATYTYMFWADNAEAGAIVPTDLKAVAYKPGNIAFAATSSGTPEDVTTDITLKHVVAKLTLQTATAVGTTYGKDISLTASCARTYNVENSTASDFTELSASMTMDATGLADDAEVLTTYLIPNPGNKAVTLKAHSMDMTIADVPLGSNTHVTLKGDLSTDNSKWRNAPAALVEETFYSYFFDEQGNPKGGQDVGSYWFDNATTNDITSFIQSIMKVDSFDLPNNYMSERKNITSNLEVRRYPLGDGDAYRFFFTYNGNETIFYIATTNTNDSSYPDFSTIYPGTN